MGDPLNDDDVAGDGNGGPTDDERSLASLAERAANGEHERDLEAPADPPVRGDAQLSLNLGSVLDRNSRKVTEATIALSAQEVPIDGLLRPDESYTFLVDGQVQHYVSVPVRHPKTGRTIGMKQRQPVRTIRVARADGPDGVRVLFERLLAEDPGAAGRLLDELREVASEMLSAVA